MTASHNIFDHGPTCRWLAQEINLRENQIPQFLHGTGLPVEALSPDSHQVINSDAMVCIMNSAQRIGIPPGAGLRMGRRIAAAGAGPITQYLLSGPDLYSALHSDDSLAPVRAPMFSTELHYRGDWLHCELKFTGPFVGELRRLMLEGFAVGIQGIVEMVLGRQAREAQYAFDYDRPSYADSYNDYLHGQVAFAAGNNELLLPRALAAFPNPLGDPLIHAAAERTCRLLLTQLEGRSANLSDQVRHVLLSQPCGTLDETQVASALFISKRTLARRLDREGSSYRAIRETLLKDLAVRYLLEESISVEAIAGLLGYYSASSFRRAFQRWFGVTPSAYRVK